VYTDGGCHGNRRDAGCFGGYGFAILDPSGAIIRQGGGVGENTTNNRMEMKAVIMGLKILFLELSINYDGPDHDCIVKTDSKYVCDNYSDYLPEWKKNGWRKSKGGEVLNKDLWKEMDKLTPEFKSFKFQWVKGHHRDKYNILVDGIAQENIENMKAHHTHKQGDNK